MATQCRVQYQIFSFDTTDIIETNTEIKLVLWIRTYVFYISVNFMIMGWLCKKLFLLGELYTEILKNKGIHEEWKDESNKNIYIWEFRNSLYPSYTFCVKSESKSKS